MGIYHTLSFVAGHPLNRGRRLRSAVDTLRFQIGSRLVPGRITVDWVNGARLHVGAGETGLTGNVYCGLHEFELMGFLLHYLRADDLFVDAGANAGSYTVLASAAVGARTIAIEPVPETHARLLDNVAINHIEDRVLCHRIGLGASERVLSFSADRDCINRVLREDEPRDRAVDVPVRRLDDVLQGHVPTLLKVDVEGYESAVLEGAAATLARPGLGAIIIELIGAGSRYGFDERKVHRDLLEQGFSSVSYDPFSRHLSDSSAQPDPKTSTLYIRDSRLLRDRLAEAPQYAIHGHLL